MITSVEADGPDLLGWWIRQPNRRGRYRTRRRPAVDPAGLRFVFYGRMSTKEWQDRLSSARWQRDFAEDTVDGRGTIVAEFFDVGCSRRLSWALRPQAALLLEALASPDRDFDAIIVGEFERAFCADEVFALLPFFARYGVQLLIRLLCSTPSSAASMPTSLTAAVMVHDISGIEYCEPV